jgi:PAP2 superfamily
MAVIGSDRAEDQVDLVIEAPAARARDLGQQRLEPAPKVKRSPVLAELGGLVFLVWIYSWLQDLAPLRRKLGLSNAHGLLSFEQRLGIDPERVMDHWLYHHQVLAFLASNFYSNAIFAVTFGFAAWLWWCRPDLYRPLRNDLVLANLIAFAVFWALPVAPPRMLAGFVDVVQKAGGLGAWHDTLVKHADQLAAMPSMHLAWAVWCSLVVWRLASPGPWRKVAATVGVIYPVATAWVVMATANHYLSDVVAGTACTVASVLVVEAAVPAVRSAFQASRRPATTSF